MSQLSSCYCQPEFLALAYSCEYIGNVSCLQTEATLSSVWGYSYCKNFQSVIGTGIVSNFISIGKVLLTSTVSTSVDNHIIAYCFDNITSRATRSFYDFAISDKYCNYDDDIYK